jgi:hypothetical protein
MVPEGPGNALSKPLFLVEVGAFARRATGASSTAGGLL